MASENPHGIEKTETFIIESAKIGWVEGSRIIRELWRGKSLYRAFVNGHLANLVLGGNILDLGSSTAGASYHRVIKYQEPCHVTFTDLYKEGQNILKLDLEKPFSEQSDTYDNITCFSVIEHVFDYRNMVEESFRVLKSGGLFVGSVPLIHRYHADPQDFMRFTHEAVIRIFGEAGFETVALKVIGYGPFTTAMNITSFMLPGWLKVIIFPIAVCKDFLLRMLRKNYGTDDAMGYVFIFRKP